MVRKLYVGNLPFSVTESSISTFFSAVGSVETVTIVTEKETGRSKGFAFVEMATADEAQRAVQELSGKELGGRTLKIDLARPREQSSRDQGPRRNGGSGNREFRQPRQNAFSRW